jgi:hypothetical protein
MPGTPEWFALEYVDNHPTDCDAVVGSDGETYYWPRCVIAGCENRACLRLNSIRCYPHTLPGVPLASDVPEPLPETVTGE